MQIQKDFVLLFGATGRTGYHVANKLIAEGYVVRIFCRSQAKLAKLFGQRQIGFEGVVEGDLNCSADLDKAFQESEHYGKISQVVVTTGAIPGQKEKEIENIQLISKVNIVDKCIKVGVKKFILISAALVERPWNPISVILNTICPNAFMYKVKFQNYLRKSGLNYIIIRPPQLIGKINDEQETEYILDQGDKIFGKITRFTLAKLTLDAMKSESIPNKVTFQCQGVKENGNKQFELLKPDTQKSILKNVPHRGAKRTYGLVILGMLIGLGYWIMSKYKTDEVIN